MPLLLKFKKKSIKKFQYGGATDFYATAGFTPSPYKFAAYNPGALLEAYKPSLESVAEKGVKKETNKLPEFKFDGKGHKLDNEISNEIINEKLNAYLGSVKAGRPVEEIQRKELDVKLTLENLNVAKATSLAQTEKAKEQTLVTNKAVGTLVFTNSQDYFGTYLKYNEKGERVIEDKSLSAYEYAELNQKNEKLKKEGKKITEYFKPMTYEELFEKRNSEYTSIPYDSRIEPNGDKIISTIANMGMGMEKVKDELRNSFNSLGETKVSQIIKFSEKIGDQSSIKLSEDFYTTNAPQLASVFKEWKNSLSDITKNTISRQAWNNVLANSDKRKTLSEDKEKRDKQLGDYVNKEYTDILLDIIDSKRKYTIKDKDVTNQILDLAASGSSAETKTPEAGVVLDVLIGDPIKKPFVETLVVNNQFVKKSTIKYKRPTNWTLLPKATQEFIIKEEEEANRLDPNKNILTSVKSQKAPATTKIKNAKIVEAKKDKLWVSLADMSTGVTTGDNSKTGFSNIGDATTLNNINIGKFADKISVTEEGEVYITWLPVNKSTGDMMLSGDNEEETAALALNIQNYNKNLEAAQKKYKADQDAKEFGEIIDNLNTEFNEKFGNYEMKMFQQIQVGIDLRVIGDDDIKEKLKKVATNEFDANSFADGSTMDNYNISLNGGGFNIRDNDQIRKIDVFVPVSNIASLRELGGGLVYTPDMYIKQLMTEDYKKLNKQPVKGSVSQIPVSAK